MQKACEQDVSKWLPTLRAGDRKWLWRKAKQRGKWRREKHQQEDELSMGTEEKLVTDAVAAMEKKEKQGKKAIKRKC